MLNGREDWWGSFPIAQITYDVFLRISVLGLMVVVMSVLYCTVLLL